MAFEQMWEDFLQRIAIQKLTPSLRSEILEKGPLVEKDLGFSLYHFLIETDIEDVELKAKVLEEINSDYNSRNDVGNTPLIEAVLKQNFELISHLLYCGADINIPNTWGETALSSACAWGYHEIIEILDKNGANWESKDVSGRTPKDYL